MCLPTCLTDLTHILEGLTDRSRNKVQHRNKQLLERIFATLTEKEVEGILDQGGLQVFWELPLLTLCMLLRGTSK